jgi:ketosteroid isomerase-like protein
MSQENVELTRRTWQLWSRGADDEIARQLATDVEWHPGRQLTRSSHELQAGEDTWLPEVE